MLGWFMSESNVKLAFDGHLIVPELIETRPNRISSAVLDPNVTGTISSIQRYFTTEAWCRIVKVIEDKCRQRIWPCAICDIGVGEGNPVGASIGCDACMLMSHKKCVNISVGKLLKSKYWFCRNCASH